MNADDYAAECGGWDGSTCGSLLADARQDDPAAWKRLVELYAPLVAAWCRRWRVVEQDVGDVLQDVFAAVARNLLSFRNERPSDTFRGWLATIARNKVRDYYRRRADQPGAAGGTEAALRIAELPDTQAPDIRAVDENHDAAGDAAFGEVLQRALSAIREEFHEQTWRAFWSVVVDGRSTAEVAAELAMQPGTVRVCKSRVLARLRRELGDAE